MRDLSSLSGSISGSTTDAYLEGDAIKVEHLFTFKLDRSMRKTADKLLDLVGEYAESFRYIAIGLAAYLLLSGMAQLVNAVGTSDDSSSKKHKKDKSSKHKDKTEAKAETKTEAPKSEPKVDLEAPK
ncbi:unnamed protein product [Cylindrotheca closterium]|uniref:Uncharacterized protein n=1 Tax=Cylindrotheca closterium TaxID=2856 RepID=A0AAD2CDB7_9STRA|nr:unnamed protein product [Cylindrotheca closterium]